MLVMRGHASMDLTSQASSSYNNLGLYHFKKKSQIFQIKIEFLNFFLLKLKENAPAFNR